MNILEFISSLAWPAVVAGTVFGFRKTIRSWLSERPDMLKAGPFEAQWSTTYEETASKFEAEVREDADDSGSQGGGPGDWLGGRLGLELREVADVAPVEAILRAWWVVEQELEGLASTVVRDESRPRRRPNDGLHIVRAEQLVPAHTLDALHSLRRLRNVAVHGVEPISTSQALEFINLADIAIGEVRPARQRRELGKAAADSVAKDTGSE